MIDDYDLIEASFAQQYGIRLRKTEMNWDEFLVYLSGLNSETPLGRIVQIRSEKDPKRIKEMTPEQRKIRHDWMEKQATQVDKNQYDAMMGNFSKLFENMSKQKNKTIKQN